MKKDWLRKVLIWYYGLLQLVHFVMNLIVIFIRPELVSLVSPLLTAQQSHYFMITSGIDFVFASPIGVAWARYYFSKHQKISMRLLSRSLIIAWLTAIVYVGLLFVFHAFVWNATTIVFGILFLPVLPLTRLILYYRKSLTF